MAKDDIKTPQEFVANRDLAAIVEEWFGRHFHNNIFSQNTEIFNRLQEAKQDLLKKLG